MSWYVFLDYIKIVYTLIILGYFSILDLKYRDIPDKLVWLSLAGSIILLLISVPSLIVYYSKYNFVLLLSSILIEALIITILVILYYYDYMGGADVIVIAELTLLYPLYKVYNYSIIHYSCIFHLPPVIVILIYASLSFLVILPIKALIILLKYRRYIPKGIPLRLKILLVFTGTIVTVKKYLEMKHYYPLTIIREENGRIVKEYRSSFNISEDYWVHQEKFRELISKGLLNPNEVIWVTYGIPFIVPLLVGFITLLLIGDFAILKLMGVC